MSKRNTYLMMCLLVIASTLLGYQLSENYNRNLVINASSLDGNLIPADDNKYVLGSKTARWKSLQLGPGTLFIEDQLTGKQAQITVNSGALEVNGANSLKIGNTELTAKGLTFPDGTIQTTAQVVGPKGEKGDTGMSGGPQGFTGPSGTSGYDPTVVCIDSIDKKMIFSSCSAAGIKGTELTILVKSKS
jgi:hypothetical protein